MKEKLKFKVGASFFALAFLALITKNAFFFGTYILAVVIHEFCHAAAARRLGYKAVEIYLSAFGAVLYGEFEGAALSDEIKIALAGPAVNLCAAALLPAVWWMFPPLYAFTQSFFVANLCVALVNLLPCYPLDGGRVLYAILGKRKGAAAEKILVRVGVVFSFLFFGLFVIISAFYGVNLTFGLFGLFLFCGACDMTKQNAYKKAAALNLNSKKLSSGMEIKTFALSADSSVAALMRLGGGHYLANVEIIENGRVIAALCYDETEKILLRYPLSARLGDIFAARNDLTDEPPC